MRQGILRPWNFAQRHCAKLGSETQRLRRDHNGVCRHWFLLSLKIARTHLCLAVQPCLRDKHGKEAENNRHADHDHGA
jgi:hypothetical protein